MLKLVNRKGQKLNNFILSAYSKIDDQRKFSMLNNEFSFGFLSENCVKMKIRTRSDSNYVYETAVTYELSFSRVQQQYTTI